MFKGSIVALATPFTQQNEVDYRTLHALIEWHIDSSTDAIVLCGCTGEASTLSDGEQVKIFKEAVLAAKGRIPLIAGTGSNNTQHAMQMTEEARKAGVDGALVILPYYNRPTSEGCFQHFQELSKVGLPLILYHHPGRTGIKLPVKALARILKLPNLVAVKDVTADLDYMIELMQEIDIPVLSGDDTLALPMMASGAVGVISIVANLIPREWKILTTLLLSDQLDEGREFFRRYYPLAKAMVLEINPQCIKYALSAIGKCSSKIRLPLIEPQETTKQQILSELVKIGLLLQGHVPERIASC
jgi:4-hydroxy-tetrahydrodipicolinate synthase